MKTLITLFFLPFLAFSQTKADFNKLIEDTNEYLTQYSKLRAYGEEYYPISEFGLSKREIKKLLIDADYDATLSKNKDSIQNYHMIFYFQEKITKRINQIVRHQDFQKVNIQELITSDELSIVISDDNKLFNFSMDAKTGGTYRSRISIMHYTDFAPQDSAQLTQFQDFFASDGYNNIYTLPTDEVIKYVMTGYVRGCSYCFQTFVCLVSFKDNQFKEEFSYSVDSRDWNDGVFYDHDTKTINVDYHVDDLTSYCYCGGENDKKEFDYDKFADNETLINCQCKFVFNGLTFELVEESWKKVNYEDRKE
ncbi:hypothetical protein [Aureivirga sp. CE67]|uniref:hypothetical protein n=1 Tax=Aureivirga sp. CE67 TaxID=1788983 RepID=UPI0018CB4989|nr:hypothetical protein [Aureivirga sp. CE67]